MSAGDVGAAVAQAGELGAWITRPGVIGEGADGPLRGATLAVKDNIDVAGLPTTAGHPAFERRPSRSAFAVQRLVDAGAVVVGKTNLDQFATGLVGTRSPYGVCRNPHLVDHIAGGSSSGSAVAVATGAVDIGLGTDTAGSGRVPAALCGVVGLKPTRGLVSVSGIVPAVAGLDCVSVFARSVGLAASALGVATGPDADDPWSRTSPPSTPAVGRTIRVGVPHGVPVGLDSAGLDAWAAARAHLGPVVEIDPGPYLEAGALLYGGAFVASRWAAFGDFLAGHPNGADPTVTQIVTRGRDLPAHALVRDMSVIKALAHRFEEVWSNVDVLAVPTVGIAPTIVEVADDPIGINNELGRWTNGTNLLDLCAAAVPAGWRADGVPFGLMFLGPAFADEVVVAAAARYLGEDDPDPSPWSGWSTIVVIGAHLTGQPLNLELVDRGGRLVRSVTTAASYRLFALPTDPPKPGLVRMDAGAPIKGELWALPLAGFGDFVRRIPAPLGIGSVELSDGSRHPGFVCEPAGLDGAPDISRFGGWVAYRAASAP